MLRQVTDRVSRLLPPETSAMEPRDLEPAAAPSRPLQWARRAHALAGRRLLVILFVWVINLLIALFAKPDYHDTALAEFLYYSFYNVAVGALVGFYLLDRVAHGGVAAFLWRSIALLVAGTLINEALVEYLVFQTGQINFEGVYYGLADAITTAGIFLLLGLTDHFLLDRQQARGTVQAAAPRADDDEAACFFVRVGGETRRIFVVDLIYMEAEKDFTRLVCSNGEHFVSESMKNLLERVAPLEIARIHKSFAVNLRRAERLTRTEVSLGDRSIPVGRTYWKTFANAWRNR